ncbi:MAG: HNH endonuclease, partial [Gordonia amarae]
MTATIPIPVQVFNADYRAFATVSWPHAVRLMLRDAVHVLENHTPAVHVHSPSRVIELPSAVVLKRYADRPYRPTGHRRPTRDDVLVRDRSTCAYCGDRADT